MNKKGKKGTTDDGWVRPCKKGRVKREGMSATSIWEEKIRFSTGKRGVVGVVKEKFKRSKV